MVQLNQRQPVDGDRVLDIVANAGDVPAELETYFSARESQQAVLGIDIYRYSHMRLETQRLIPTTFAVLRHAALETCKEKEAFLFKDHFAVGPFVSTGDGGFQVFPTPLHGVVFAIYFEMYLAALNDGFVLRHLRAALGQSINVRYALTYDSVFEQGRNIFGAGIISNARIMARDKLNRFLLDHLTMEWFQRNFASVESLLVLRGADLAEIPALDYDDKLAQRSTLFSSPDGKTGIRSVHLQKIGIVESKQTILDVYSLMIQASVTRNTESQGSPRTVVITVGNLNPDGIVA